LKNRKHNNDYCYSFK